MPLLLIVFAPALAALILPFVPTRALVRMAVAVPALSFLYLVTRTPETETLSFALDWVPSLGVSLAFGLDGLGWLFALIISGIGALVLLYTADYFDDAAEAVRFSVYLLLFMMAMLGIVLTTNLLVLFIFWEITSVTSYLLIGFKHEKEAAREGARQALLITGGGGLVLMAGILLIGLVAGTFDMNVLLTGDNILRDHALYVPILMLICIGAFTKSAQFPFHFWLPGAMEAPTPASTYLHSATMVKAGIFLLARLSPVLDGTDVWFYMLTIVGLVTFVYGAVVALRHTDLKAILAYSTVSWLGVLVAVQGAGSEYGGIALIVGIIAHALYKGALFLIAGSIDHAAGTRDINRLGGLMRKMPITFVGALVAVLSMAGIPPLTGFLAKEVLKAASLYKNLPPEFQVIFPIAAVVGSALTVAVGLRLLWDTFIAESHDEAVHHAHEASPGMWLGPLVLGGFTIILPLFMSQTFDPVVGLALTALEQEPMEVHLHLFEGITPPLIMSIISITAGVMIFAVRRPVIRWMQTQPEFNPRHIYEWFFLRALPDGALWLTHQLQNGRLRYYLLIVIIVFIGLSAGTMILGQINFVSDALLAGLDWQVALICFLICLGALATVAAPTRLSAIAVIGIEGALLSLLFALFGAPDLAFTQLMIEVVTLVLFILAFHFLPDAFIVTRSRVFGVFDTLVALMAGVSVTLLILAAKAHSLNNSISSWFVENAVPIGQGHNVVNVILVDFRGLDTQGEIVVLVIAAMGVAALLRLRPFNQPRGKYVTAEIPAIDVPETAKQRTRFEPKSLTIVEE